MTHGFCGEIWFLCGNDGEETMVDLWDNYDGISTKTMMVLWGKYDGFCGESIMDLWGKYGTFCREMKIGFHIILKTYVRTYCVHIIFSNFHNFCVSGVNQMMFFRFPRNFHLGKCEKKNFS